MVADSTVLILGAGASHHLGYPLGRGLREEVINGLNNGQKLARVIGGLGYSAEAIKDFQTALSASGQYSVDAFLERREEFLDMGKAALAYQLIRNEHRQKLYAPSWYQYLFNRMCRRFEEFAANKLTIVTFNYDRSLEMYLFGALSASYNRSSAETVAALQSIRIVHVHGRLDPLPWEEKDGRQYSPTLNPDHISKAAKGIKIVHEASADGEEFRLARAALHESMIKVFLGFGYDETNCTRIGISKIKVGKVTGTAMGLLDGERHTVERLFDPTGGIELGRGDADILTFIRETEAF